MPSRRPARITTPPEGASDVPTQPAAAAPSGPLVLNSLRVQNLRSIIDETFEFASLGVLVGPNNAGKTNIMSAVQFLLEGSEKGFGARDYHDENQPVVVEGELTGVAAYLPLIGDERNRARIAALVQGDALRIRRTAAVEERSSGKLEVQNADSNAFESLPTGIDNSVKPLLPEVLLIEAFIDPSAHADGKDTAALGKLLKQVLAGIQADTEAALAAGLASAHKLLNVIEQPDGTVDDERSPHLTRIAATLTDFIAESFRGAKARIVVDMPEIKSMLGKARVQLTDGQKWTDTDLKGQGQQRALYVALLRTLALQRRAGATGALLRPFILLMEEPEVFLHPSAHAVLRSALESISRTNQVMYTTHAPSMVSPASIRETLLIRQAAPDAVRAGTIRLRPLNLELEGRAARTKMLFEYPRSSKFLFTASALVVEGASDAEVLEAVFLAKHGLTFDDVSVACIDATSKDVLVESMDILKQRGLSVHGVVDLDFLWRGAGSLLPDSGAHSRFCDAFWVACQEAGLCKGGEPRKLRDGTSRRAAATLVLERFGADVAAFRTHLRENFGIWVLGQGEIEVYAGLSASAKREVATAVQELRAGSRAPLHADELGSLFDWAGLTASADTLRSEPGPLHAD